MQIDYSKLPHHMQDGMKLYIEEGIEPGSFMSAVLCNDLMEACNRADHVNIERLRDYASFLYNHAPRSCYGSREIFSKWIGHGGLNGLMKANTANSR